MIRGVASGWHGCHFRNYAFETSCRPELGLTALMQEVIPGWDAWRHFGPAASPVILGKGQDVRASAFGGGNQFFMVEASSETVQALELSAESGEVTPYVAWKLVRYR